MSKTPLSPHIKKVYGGVLIMVFLAGYIYLAATLAGMLPDNILIKAVYYAVIGIGWGIPLIPLLSWMDKDK